MAYTRNRALIELTAASVLWGMGFVATVWALRSFESLALVALRFFVAAVLGMLLLAVIQRRHPWRILRDEASSFVGGILPGIFLGLGLVMQTEGLLSTTATRSGFLTTLYVVVIPVFSGLRKLIARHWCAIGLALLGTALLCRCVEWDGAQFLLQWGAWTVGDTLTVLCAIAFAFQFLSVDRALGRMANVDPLLFNVAQMFWGGVVACVGSVLKGESFFPKASDSWLPIMGFGFLVVFSSVIAFGIQVRAQRVLSPFVTGILCLLESVFAACFGALFLAERLGNLQIAGAVIIFFAAVLSSLPRRSSRIEHRPT